ncbi:MAG TPA: RnfABCDGE type electron transport complex subunit B [Solimonas sp.]
MSIDTVALLESILPQTQCRQCEFDGCRPYAVALAAGTAATDRCPPGGDEGAKQLAAALQRPYRPVDPRYGMPKRAATRVVIDEAVCIGCTKCIQACPVDAIAGANQLMHTVIASECTGCELCIPPCPVDCIAIVPAQSLSADAAAADYRRHVEAQRPRAYRRYHARNERLEKVERELQAARAQRKASLQLPDVSGAGPTPTSDDPIARALAAAKARRSTGSGTAS